MNKITYPKPDFENLYYLCYKNKDNPVLVLKEIVNGNLIQWYAVDKATGEALDWAKKATEQSASPYRGRITILPNLKLNARNVYFNSNIFKPQYIVVTRTGASCKGVRFERLADVQRFRAAAVKVLDILR